MIPPIPKSITLTAFQDAYWHRTSLTQYCRDKGLPTSGSKLDLTERIAAFLSGRKAPKLATVQRGAMPDTFTMDTVIGENWRCCQSLRAFFETHAKTRFSFNKELRDFIANGSGKTLAEALQHWEATKGQRTQTIAPQFEYNRFMREYFATTTNADLSSAYTAWKTHRDTPKSLR